MEVDVLGINPVLSLIEQSGHNKFIIVKSGQARSMPIFDYSNGNSNKAALDQFKKWADAMQQGSNSGQPYEIILFTTNSSLNEDETEATGKKGKIRFSFSLNPNGTSNSINGVNQTPQHIGQLIEQAVQNALLMRDLSDLKKENAAIKERLEQLDEDEDEDEGEINGNDYTDLIRNAGSIMALLSGKTETKKETVLNGSEQSTETDYKMTPEQIKNVTAAVKTMFKHNSELDKDLLKLAALSESNPSQFQFLINALRNL